MGEFKDFSEMPKRCATECYEHKHNIKRRKIRSCYDQEDASRWCRRNETIPTKPLPLEAQFAYPTPESTPPRTNPPLPDGPDHSSRDNTAFQHPGITYHLPPNPCLQVELRKSEICGGHGLFAARDFAQGELIFTEAPWLSVPVRGDVDSVPTPAEVSAAVEAAIDADIGNEARYHFLHPPNTSSEASLRTKRDRKFETNCWQTSEPALDEHGASIVDAAGRPRETHHRRIGYLLSTPNHACSPDIQPTWRPAQQHWVVHALRDIRRGEELFVSYDPARDWNLRVDRQLALEFSHAFRCTCAACSSLDAELRRAQYQGYRRALAASDARRAKGAGDFVVAARLSYDAWCLVWRDLDSSVSDLILHGHEAAQEQTEQDKPRTVPRRVSPRFIEACEDLARRSIDAYIDLAGKYPDLATATDFGRRLFRQGALVYETAEEAYRLCYGADDPNAARVRERHEGHWQTLLRACRGGVPVEYFEADACDARVLGERWRRLRSKTLIVRLKVRVRMPCE